MSKEENVSKEVNRHQSSMYLSLDRFQRMKLSRMKYLLEEIERKGEMPVSDFLSYIDIRYGIRKITGEEYLEAWCNYGLISINNNIIKFVKKPEWWK